MHKLQLLEEHFLNNYDTMVKQARRKVGDFWCDDVVSETYTRCLRYIGGIPDDAKIANYYIYKTMRGVVKDYLSDKISAIEVEEDMLESGELVNEWEAKGILKRIKEDMSSLPSPKREVVFGALIHGDKHEILSQINKVSIVAVRKMVSRYKQELEERYG